MFSTLVGRAVRHGSDVGDGFAEMDAGGEQGTEEPQPVAPLVRPHDNQRPARSDQLSKAGPGRIQRTLQHLRIHQDPVGGLKPMGGNQLQVVRHFSPRACQKGQEGPDAVRVRVGEEDARGSGNGPNRTRDNSPPHGQNALRWREGGQKIRFERGIDREERGSVTPAHEMHGGRRLHRETIEGGANSLRTSDSKVFPLHEGKVLVNDLVQNPPMGEGTAGDCDHAEQEHGCR